MTYNIWLDESDKAGLYYGNFYGGILIKSCDLEEVLSGMKRIVEEVGLENEEIKWQKVNDYVFNKYIRLIDFLFDLLKEGKVKIRIFFKKNTYIPQITNEQKEKSYSILYYEFIKHAFGFQYSNTSKKAIRLELFLDEMPLKYDDKVEFRKYICGLNYDTNFKKGKIFITNDDIHEVNSKKHLPLQFMDLVLGSINFRLNNKHKIKDPITGKRAKRTICKEKLYKHINSRIRLLRQGFNIGESTGLMDLSERWTQPYRHWSFVPYNYIEDKTKNKS